MSLILLFHVDAVIWQIKQVEVAMCTLFLRSFIVSTHCFYTHCFCFFRMVLYNLYQNVL